PRRPAAAEGTIGFSVGLISLQMLTVVGAFLYPWLRRSHESNSLRIRAPTTDCDDDLRRRFALFDAGGGFAADERCLLGQPCLEHQRVPEGILPVAVAGEVFGPLRPDWVGVEHPFAFEPVFGQEILGPVAQRAADPGGDRDPETHLGAVHEG